MECIRCGGKIDPATGVCSVCGALSDAMSEATIVHGIDELAERYGLTVEEDGEALPALFSGYEKKVTRRAKVMQEAAEEKSAPAGNPSIGLSEYVKLLGVDSAQEIENPRINDGADAPQREQRAQMQSERGFQEEQDEYHPILMKIDNIIEKPADKVLDMYYSKHPRPTRARRSQTSERLLVLAGVLAAVIVLVILTAVILNSIAPDITGEWLISETNIGERLTIEFTKSHDVTVRVYSEKENIYQTGTYKVRRSNGYNLLTISYDNGTERRLYYDLDKDSGTFTNMDTNNSDVYRRIK